MSLLEAVLIVATLLCALVAGFAFAFATVVMPGIAKLTDAHFIRAFQVIDGVIQAGQPVFGLVWAGSAVALGFSAVLAALQVDSLSLVVIAAALAYAAGVQLPTFKINVPLNNMLQSVDVDSSDDKTLAAARRDFEHRWVKWNAIRTGVASLVSILLMFSLLRI